MPIFIKKILKNIFLFRLIKKLTDNKVAYGPFAGMIYATSNIEDTYLPYLLGTYELELHSTIEALCEKSFDTIVNVGAGRGYYVVGLAIRNPQTHVIAFEANAEERASIKQLARANNIYDRLTINELCDATLLSDSLPNGKRRLVLMDIEGGESILLDPAIVPKLKGCHILVELHDFIFRAIGNIISKRFQDSHKITEIWSRPRDISDFPLRLHLTASFILKRFLTKAMDEHRPEKMRWFYLEPSHD